MHLGSVTDVRRDEDVVGTDAAQSAFDALYRRTYAGLLALAVATVGSRSVAEDRVHDAYAQLWTHRTTVSRPEGWLRRAVVNNCLSYLRTQRRREGIVRRQPLAAESEAPDERAFLELLTGLNDRQRIAITLRYLENFTEAEIAEVMGCRPGTVKSTLHRAMKVLRAGTKGKRL
ncbi:RNA polymerase sigma factor [Terrabacter sp. Ter38]|uniref:RNA polymerase sigma factor n=1 Tax=Terrabacter sp. Ter38 TaxID=2926030 RepID=UPI0035B2E899